MITFDQWWKSYTAKFSKMSFVRSELARQIARAAWAAGAKETAQATIRIIKETKVS